MLSQDQLRTAFENVQDPTDWRGPIDFAGDMHPEDVAATVAAIRHFTATEPKVSTLANGETRIESVGYRMGPAGP